MIKIKNDKYKKARGGSSKLLDIYCRNCGFHSLLYQKDGRGSLKRLYMDRILAPEELEKFQYYKDIKTVPSLACKHCENILAVPYVYKKERRKAFLVITENIIKKNGKLIKNSLQVT